MDAMKVGGDYLFIKDRKDYSSEQLDTGDKSFQCGRHIDILKLWLYFKGNGLEKIQAGLENCEHLARYFADKVRRSEEFELAYEPQTCICNFYFVPKALRGMDIKSDEFKEKIKDVAPKIKVALSERGKIMLTYSPTVHAANHFKMICINPSNTEADMDFVFDEMKACALASGYE